MCAPGRTVTASAMLDPNRSGPDDADDEQATLELLASGKSHSGRSPATGLYTHAAVFPSSSTVQYKVAFEAATSRPSTVRSPVASSSSAGSSSQGPDSGG